MGDRVQFHVDLPEPASTTRGMVHACVAMPWFRKGWRLKQENVSEWAWPASSY